MRGTGCSGTRAPPNNLNQYAAVGSVSPTYDGNGNLTSDGQFTCCYDTESRLTSILSAGTCAPRQRPSRPTSMTARAAQIEDGRVDDHLLRHRRRQSRSARIQGAGAQQNWCAFALGPDAALNQMNVASNPNTRATLIPEVIGSSNGSLDAAYGTLAKTGYQTFGENPSLRRAALGPLLLPRPYAFPDLGQVVAAGRTSSPRQSARTGGERKHACDGVEQIAIPSNWTLHSSGVK
jgi:hypothetical protein